MNIDKAAALARYPVGSIVVATRDMPQLDDPSRPVRVGERLRIRGWHRRQDGHDLYGAWRLDFEPQSLACVSGEYIVPAPPPAEKEKR